MIKGDARFCTHINPMQPLDRTPLFDSHVAKNERTPRDDKPYQIPSGGNTSCRSDKRDAHRPFNKSENGKRPSLTWPDINILSISHEKLVGVLKQMGGMVRWPQKMRTTDGKRDISK